MFIPVNIRPSNSKQTEQVISRNICVYTYAQWTHVQKLSENKTPHEEKFQVTPDVAQRHVEKGE